MVIMAGIFEAPYQGIIHKSLLTQDACYVCNS